MARRGDDLNRGVADRELHAVGADGVALRLAARAVRRLVDGIPIRTAVHEVRRRHLVLKESRAAVVVAVGVRNDDVLDLVDVEAKFPHPACDLVRRRVVEERLEDDDAFAADESPGVVDLGAEEIEVVGDLRGLGVPRGPSPAVRPVRRSRAPRLSRTPRRRRHDAQAQERAWPVEARGILCGGNEAVHGLAASVCVDATSPAETTNTIATMIIVRELMRPLRCSSGRFLDVSRQEEVAQAKASGTR